MKINIAFILVITIMFTLPLTAILLIDDISLIPTSVTLLFGAFIFMPLIAGILYLMVEKEAKIIDERVK